MHTTGRTRHLAVLGFGFAASLVVYSKILGPFLTFEGETLVVESSGFDERTYVQPNGWFHSDALKVTERYTRPSMNYLIVEITVDDPKVLLKPWKSAPRRWTLGNGEIYEFYCTNNLELEELEKLRQQELQQKK